MDLMYVISSPGAAEVLVPLLSACRRRGASWGCFFTDDGVQALDDARVRDLMSCAQRAVACELSWERFQHGRECPVELGSQTNNSAMMSEARHVISF